MSKLNKSRKSFDLPEFQINFSPFYGCQNQTIFDAWEIWLYSWLGGTASLAIILLNVVIYAAFFKQVKLRRLPCARIIWHVMVPSDMLIGVVAIPGLLTYYLCGNGFPLPKELCDLWYFLDYLGSNVSKYSVALVALERFVAIGWPYRHAKIMSTRGEIIIIILIWVLCLIWLGGEMIIWPHVSGFRAAEPKGVCDHPLYYSPIISIIHRVFAWYIPFFSTVICYIGLSIFVIKSVKSINRFLESKEQKKRMRDIRKTFRITTCVVVSFAICWFPYQFIEVFRAAKIVKPGKYSPVEITVFVGFLNSLVNPVSYFFMDLKFRKAVQNLFGYKVTLMSSVSAVSVSRRTGSGYTPRS